MMTSYREYVGHSQGVELGYYRKRLAGSALLLPNRQSTTFQRFVAAHH